MKEFNIYTGEKGKLKYKFTSVFESEEEALKEAAETLKFEYEALPNMPTYEDALNDTNNKDPYEKVRVATVIYYNYILNWGEYKVVPTEEDSVSQDDLIKAYASDCDESKTSI